MVHMDRGALLYRLSFSRAICLQPFECRLSVSSDFRESTRYIAWARARHLTLGWMLMYYLSSPTSQIGSLNLTA
jgi:hypothetical protein